MDVGRDDGKSSGLIPVSRLVTALTIVGRRSLFGFPASKKISRPIDSLIPSLHDVGIRLTNGRRGRRDGRKETKTTRNDSLLLNNDAVSTLGLFVSLSRGRSQIGDTASVRATLAS